jgi:hypothetical protein
MKKIHIIPTDKPSRLFNDGIDLYLSNLMDRQGHPVTSYNIYITSDENIKEGDWVFNFEYNYIVRYDSKKHDDKFWYKKIILTTDQDLIKDGVQAIDDEFLEWFVENPSCEFVEIVKEKIILGKVAGTTYTDFNYKIIIPKEELKQEKTFKDILDESLTKGKVILEELKVINAKRETLELKRNYQKHSLTKTKGYKLWCNIIQRCYNPKNHSYKYYGEKGVIMEDYFKNSYENFISWLKGLRYYDDWLESSELSLDRIDNTLGYSRGNLKFSTKTEQVENQNLRLDNKSGYKGVCYHKLNKKYGATITIDKSKVFLGYYDTALEAALVYDNYVLKNNLNKKTNL